MRWGWTIYNDKSDGANILSQLSLIDMSLALPQNGVALCGQCHIRYDEWSWWALAERPSSYFHDQS
jgi:hypothetical protein